VCLFKGQCLNEFVLLEQAFDRGAIWVDQGALSILLSISPLSLVNYLCVSIACEPLLPELLSVAVFQALLPLALVDQTVSLEQGALAVPKSILKIALVPITVGPGVSSLTVHEIVFEVSNVLVAAGPSIGALA